MNQIHARITESVETLVTEYQEKQSLIYGTWHVEGIPSHIKTPLNVNVRKF
jgi:hypothetical protein